MYFFRNWKGYPCCNTEVYSPIPYISTFVHVFRNEVCTKVGARLYHDTIRLNRVQHPLTPRPLNIFVRFHYQIKEISYTSTGGYSIYHFWGGKITYKLHSNNTPSTLSYSVKCSEHSVYVLNVK